MDQETRERLRAELSTLVADMAAEMRAQLLAEGPARDRGLRLHVEERVGEDYAVWTDVLARRAAVLWVLKSLYVRVLEDRRLLRPGRILDEESQALFERLAPDLGQTAYLRWIFRDLSTPAGGLPELFAPQPAEIVGPSDALARRLLALWRRRDPDTGVLAYRFDEESFDGRLLGDLYQDLDPVVRDRYALVQTPDFIVDFILDETLSPAIAEWGVEQVRVADISCGSGHFLLSALGRLVAGMRSKHPERPVREIVADCLARVVGIDINDYACALARARLVMTALVLCGEDDLAAASGFHPRVFWADALEQVENAEQQPLGTTTPKLAGMLTPAEVREVLRPVLLGRFHAVVGNPPFITEKDPARRAYHREQVDRRRRYVSAAGKYSLGAPFTERMLQLAVDGGCVGEIVADSFMKREFGKALVEKILARKDLRKVVATSGAYIPGHGTPTVLLFARNRPPEGMSVRVVMSRRGEPGRPADPRTGRVWTSIVAGHEQVGFENEYISVADVAREQMSKHPWSIGGGGAAELKRELDERAATPLSATASDVGIAAVTGEDDVFAQADTRLFTRIGVRPTKVLGVGEDARDWALWKRLDAVWPYDEKFGVEPLGKIPTVARYLWPYRSVVSKRKRFGTPMLERGLAWYEWQELYDDKLRTPYSIAFGEVSTHNHFVLDRGGKVFNRTAPVIKLPAGAGEAEHLVILAQLNSSTGCFWLKQVCQNKGIRGQGGGFTIEQWEQFFQFGGTKLESFPLVATADAQLEAFAARLDALGRERVEDSAAATIAAGAASGARPLREALDARRERDRARLFQMVGLQEELDWLCYKLYGIDPEVAVRAPDEVPPLVPGLRPFEIVLAREDAERRAALCRGEEPDEQPTAWFERHGWEPRTTADDLSPAEREIVVERIARTEASRNLGLVEQATCKRRWYRPDHEAEEREALALWLADRIEDWARTRSEPFTVRQAAAALEPDRAVQAVAELLAGTHAFDLGTLVAERVRADAVPGQKHHVFKPSGLIKRATWERCWELQLREDAGESVTPEVPEKYDSKDFLRPEYWRLRGKLDVPKERFVAFTEMPGAQGDEALFGWAGWPPRQRARVLLGLDERAEADGAPLAARIGLLHGAWSLLPFVAWESRDAADEFRAVVRAQVGSDGVTERMLEAWAAEHPPTGGRARGRRR